jgi:hypothetical protein
VLTSVAMACQSMSLTAVREVANGMFGRDWKMATCDEFDKDTPPEKIRVIQALRQIET